MELHESFERWIVSKAVTVMPILARDSEGRYINDHTKRKFEIFKAGYVASRAVEGAQTGERDE